ncbi:MAG: MlaE family ABC transporter permease [Solirubrobacteraceae bacterium]
MRGDPTTERELPGFQTAGEIVLFSMRAVRLTPRARHYAGEVLRQAGLLVTGSTLVITLVTFLAGQSCGLESSFIARALSTPTLGPAASFGCAVVYVVPFLYGYVLAAKVGCGFVAELGAMRVREEVDALDVLGIQSMVYLVSVRLVATVLTVPFIYVIGLGAGELGVYLQSLGRFHDVSVGEFTLYHFSFYNPTDLLLSFLQGLTISGVVVATALYFGYTVRGGPVEVGVATARSMAANLVLVTTVNCVFIVLFLIKSRLPVA